jgi:hypothetical protein
LRPLRFITRLSISREQPRVSHGVELSILPKVCGRRNAARSLSLSRMQNRRGGGDTSLSFSECQQGQPGHCRISTGEISEPGYPFGELIAMEEIYKYA